MLAETFNRMASDLQATTVSKASVDNILESMSELLVVTNARLEIQLVNRAGQEQLGYTAQELIGRPLARLFADPIPSGGNRHAYHAACWACGNTCWRPSRANEFQCTGLLRSCASRPGACRE